MTRDYSRKKLSYKPEGTRNIGRPQTGWGDDFWEEGTSLIVDGKATTYLQRHPHLRTQFLKYCPGPSGELSSPQ